ncbi:MAG TPA: FAD-dependent monooxygenase [Xanthobacteraceae bacterium]|nr:FAD-dependent monooxygenase [Xanthobacteraceae bacterium]
MSPSRTALIAGAGIGGLAAAIGLAKAGIRSIVFERDATPDTSGAGIQLSPNATRALEALGVLDAVAARSVEPRELIVANALSGATLATMPLGEAMRRKFHSPYLVCLRADLHEALAGVAQNNSLIELRYGSTLRDVIPRDDGVTAQCESEGRSQHIAGDLLIGADGIRSVVREKLFRGSSARHGGMAAWRATIPLSSLAGITGRDAVRVWLGPGGHLVHYPVGDGSLINLVAVATDSRASQSWGEENGAAEVLSRFVSWHETPRAVIAAAPEYRRWSLFEASLLPAWSKGAVTLLGDAAHGMFPFVAQGAAAALEDAVALGEVLRDAGDVPAALRAYEQMRKPRTTQIQSSARNIGRIYHMPRPFSFGRDMVMKQIGGEGLMRQNAWIYRG